MRSSPDLGQIALVFASGTEPLNRQLIDRVASLYPGIPLLVMAEFEPHRGEWIPYHVLRSFAQNLAAVKAAVAGRGVRLSAALLVPDTPFAAMKWMALRISPIRFLGFNEHLETFTLRNPAAWGRHGVQRIRNAFRTQFTGIGRGRKWLLRLAHPGDAEIPLRARAAQLYGVLASYSPLQAREKTMAGTLPLKAGVSVVIPSRDGRELLARLLPTLMPQVTQGEVIVSDNGSSDGTAAWLAREYPGVRVLQSPNALSFARAVNAGISEARFTRTFLLNNDMVLRTSCIEALARAFDRIPDLFCSTAQIFFPEGVRRQETGKAVWRKTTPLDFPVRCDDPLPGEDLTWVLYGSGGCSLFDTEKLRGLGGVSEAYDPAYVEDMDFGYRAWKRGWPSVYSAGATVEHRHRATTARFFSEEQLQFFVERNYLRFLTNGIASPALFRRLWREAIRRLQLLAISGEKPALGALRHSPNAMLRPSPAAGLLTEGEILALGNGDVAVFPGRAPRRDGTVVIASPYAPFPLSHGAAVRIFNLMKLAAETRNQVLIAFVEELAPPAAELLEICSEVVLVKRHGTHYRKNTPRPDVVEEFSSDTFRAALKQTIAKWKPAIAQLEFTQMAQYAEARGVARTILVEHDITFDLQGQLLAAPGLTGAARMEAVQQCQKWTRFETDAWTHVDCVVTMSEKDRQAVNGAGRVECLANGVDVERFQPAAETPEPRRLLFIGSFAHLPNLLGLDYFIREIWPLLSADYRLHVIAGAGHRPISWLDHPSIEVEAFVSDVRPAYARAEIVIVPLIASAGTNIKVMEAMAMGKAIVSTPAGLNGLSLDSPGEVRVAATAGEFARHIREISADPELRAELGRRARSAALRTFDWRVIAERQEHLYGSLESGISRSPLRYH